MSFNRVPEKFMQGIFITPHNFNDPENPVHGQYVNLQLRNDLYFSTFNEISNVQFSIVPFSDEWVQVDNMTECKGDMPWFTNYLSMYKQKKGRSLANTEEHKVQMLACQDWQVSYHRGNAVKKSRYRVKVLQSDRDVFKTQISPPTLFKSFKDFFLN